MRRGMRRPNYSTKSPVLKKKEIIFQLSPPVPGILCFSRARLAQRHHETPTPLPAIQRICAGSHAFADDSPHPHSGRIVEPIGRVAAEFIAGNGPGRSPCQRAAGADAGHWGFAETSGAGPRDHRPIRNSCDTHHERRQTQHHRSLGILVGFQSERRSRLWQRENKPFPALAGFECRHGGCRVTGFRHHRVDRQIHRTRITGSGTARPIPRSCC
jgi:hypothetical protein